MTNAVCRETCSGESGLLSDLQAAVNTIPVDGGKFLIREALVTGSKALHAARPFEGGEILSAIGMREQVQSPNYLSVQFGEFEHGMLHPVHLQYINHSCSPNVFFDVKAMHLRALRTIGQDEELSFFYPSTEWNMNQPFHCHCHSPSCLGHIQGAAYLPESILIQYELSEHIKDLMQRARTAARCSAVA
ncbi:MAG: protein-lysine N-methyltransferase [Rhodocyclaceae bacterium]|nr:protein-lysine N-methyltransferase [Rhodocyclaceae bacterium]